MSEKSARLVKDFLYDNRITISEFARVTGLSRTTLYNYLKGGNIHPKAAKKIEDGVQKTYRILLHWEKLID